MGVSCVIVDDNGTLVKAARVLLEREGVTVAGTASSGAEARELAGVHQPDVMLVDIVLEAESGFNLARELASEGRLVILMSAYTEPRYRALGSHSTTIGFLDKAELSAARIRALLGASRIPGGDDG